MYGSTEIFVVLPVPIMIQTYSLKLGENVIRNVRAIKPSFFWGGGGNIFKLGRVPCT